MSNPEASSGPSLQAVRQYLSRFQEVTQTPPRTGGAAMPPNAQQKYRSPHEDRWRRRVVQVALPIGLFFLACAASSLALQRSVVPLHFGSHLLIELALQWYPGAYLLAVLHNLALAAVAGGFAVAASGGHMEIPGVPGAKETIVSRRVARFAYRQFLGFMLLMGLGVALHLHDWRIFAAAAEGAAFVCLLGMAANLWVPVLRMFLLIELDFAHDGLMNRIVIGHGPYWRRGTLIILHDRLIDVTSFAGPLEACFGLRSLRFVFWDDTGTKRVVELRAFGTADLTSEVEHFCKGLLRSARGTKAIESGTSLQSMTIINR